MWKLIENGSFKYSIIQSVLDEWAETLCAQCPFMVPGILHWFEDKISVNQKLFCVCC